MTGVRRTERGRVDDEGSLVVFVMDSFEHFVSGTAKTVGLDYCAASLIVACKFEQQAWWPSLVYLDARQSPVGVKLLGARNRAYARCQFSSVAVRDFPSVSNECGTVRVTP